LIEAALLLAKTVERYRNQNVRGQSLGCLPDNFGQLFGIPCPEWLDPLILEGKDGANECTLVDSEAAR